MAPARARSRSSLLPIALGSLAGAFSSIVVPLVPAVLGAATLIGREAATAGLLALSLPLDTLFTKDVGGFTIRLAHAVSLLLAFRILLNTVSRKGSAFRLPSASLVVPLGGFFIILALGLGSTYDIRKSVGYLAWAGFDLLVLGGSVLAWVRTSGRAQTLTRAFLWGQILVAGYGFAQVAAYAGAEIRLPGLTQVVNGWPRLHAFHYEPQYYAFYSIQAVSMLLLWWIAGFRPFKRITAAPILLMLTASTFLSLSRSGWLALAILSVVAVARPPLRSLKRWGVLLLLAAAIVGGWVAFPNKFRKVLGHMGSAAVDLSEPTSTAPRIESIRYGARLIRSHPWLGVGIGNYGGAMYEEVWLKSRTETERAAAWHAVVPANMWIELLAETGVLGTGAFLVFLFVLFLKMGRAARRAAPSAAFPGAPAYGLVEGTTSHPGVEDVALASLIRGYRLALSMTFFVMYQFAQTLWRLDTWFLMAMCVALCELRRGGAKVRSYSTTK